MAAGALGAKATGGDAAYGAITAATVHLFKKDPEIYRLKAKDEALEFLRKQIRSMPNEELYTEVKD